MTKRPWSSVTTTFAYLVGRSLVSAMIQTPASGPFSPSTCPPMSWAEISIVAANTVLPCSSASVPALPRIHCFSFMFSIPSHHAGIPALSPCPRLPSCAVRHDSNLDQHVLLVERFGEWLSLTATGRLSHGEKRTQAAHVVDPLERVDLCDELVRLFRAEHRRHEVARLGAD